MNENSLTLKKQEADYADDLELLENKPAQAQCLPYSLEWAVRGIGFYVNADKTIFLCFKQDGLICTLNDLSLKLVNHLTLLDSNISSTESDVSIGKA